MSGLVGSLVGMLASIPAVAVAKAVFVYYFEKHTGRRIVSPEGVFFKGATAPDDVVDPIADATRRIPTCLRRSSVWSSARPPKQRRRKRAVCGASDADACAASVPGRLRHNRRGLRGSGQRRAQPPLVGIGSHDAKPGALGAPDVRASSSRRRKETTWNT